MSQNLSEIVISHDFSLSALLVVNSLALVLLSKSSYFSNVSLEVTEFVLGVGDIGLNLSDIFNSSVDFAVQLIVFVFVAEDLLLENVLLILQLVLIFLQVINLSTHTLVVEFMILESGVQIFIVFSHTSDVLFKFQSFVEKLFVVSKQAIEFVLELVDFNGSLIQLSNKGVFITL